MWSDNETEKDFLNFSGVAGTVAEIIVQADGRPISIGISGAWGVGKSSMIKLVRTALNERVTGSSAMATPKKPARDFVFVEFNAWLYQGYDDARAALVDVIAGKLQEEAEARKTGLNKVKELIGRVNWLRAAKLLAGPAAALAFGIPPVGLAGQLVGLGKSIIAGHIDGDTVKTAGDVAKEASDEFGGFLTAKVDTSPPKEIHALRENFEEILQQMGITLVVLIDDLDRCLPETTISTLEAIRLFLFLNNTAFVIAADDGMIKHAVRKHFDGVTDDLVTNYFDKLIQVPVRVPSLGTQEVRAYLMLLFVENSGLPVDEIERIRLAVCKQLQQTWQGKRVDRNFVQSLSASLPQDLVGRLDTADRLAPIMATASRIAGNPRLIKRFLNALSIRMAISRAQGVGVDEAALAKMLLFERSGNATAYAALAKAVAEEGGGRPTFLADWEDDAHKGNDLKLTDPWDGAFVPEWLRLPPRLADLDLRGILYVSREHAPLVTSSDRLSSEAAELLVAVTQHPDMAASLKVRLGGLARAELAVIMDHLLEQAGREQEWGAPSILTACVTVAEIDPPQGHRLGAFLAARPHAQIRASIVPKIDNYVWAKSLLNTWEVADSIAKPVKAAIINRRKNGNVSVQ
jgi:predicted KAP-like P-loop ATPase